MRFARAETWTDATLSAGDHDKPQDVQLRLRLLTGDDSRTPTEPQIRIDIDGIDSGHDYYGIEPILRLTPRDAKDLHRVLGAWLALIDTAAVTPATVPTTTGDPDAD